MVLIVGIIVAKTATMRALVRVGAGGTGLLLMQAAFVLDISASAAVMKTLKCANAVTSRRLRTHVRSMKKQNKHISRLVKT